MANWWEDDADASWAEEDEVAQTDPVLGKGPATRYSRQVVEAPKMGFGQKLMQRIDESNKGAIGAADIAKTMATGAVGSVAGGAVAAPFALAEYAAERMGGEKNPDLDKASAVYDAVSGAITADLWTKPGKDTAAAVGKIAQKMHVDKALQKADDAFYWFAKDDPFYAAVTKATIYAIPELFGIKLGRGAEGIRGLANSAVSAAKYSAKKANIAKLAEAQMVQAKKSANRLGINLNNDELYRSTIAAANDLSNNIEYRGQGVEEIPEALRANAAASKKAVQDLFDHAKTKDAYMSITPVQKSVSDFTTGLINDRFDVAEMPELQARLKDIAKLQKEQPNRKAVLPDGTSPVIDLSGNVSQAKAGSPLAVADEPVRFNDVGLSQMGLIRGRITDALKKVPKDRSMTSEEVALVRLKKHMDDMLENQFERDMIAGDPDALTAWKKALAGKREHAAKYESDKTIRNLITGERSALETYTFIKGASTIGAKQRAIGTLRRLKDLLGEDSEGYRAIKYSAIYDALEPALHRNDPVLAGTRIDKLLDNNRELVNELGLNIDDLRTVRQALKAAETVKPLPPQWTQSYFTKLAASAAMGHQISRKGRMVQFSTKVLDKLLRTGVMNEKEILERMVSTVQHPLGDYMGGPSKKEVIVYGAIADAANRDDDE